MVTVNLDGLPPGAKVLIDGWEKRPPLELPESREERQLSVEAPGYRTETRRFVPDRDQTLSLRAELLPAEPASPPAKLDAVINIASDPPGALVWIDDDPVSKGRTPLALSMPLSSEPRKVTLQLNGYRLRSLVVVPDGDRTPDVIRLVRTSSFPRGKAKPARPQPPEPDSEITKAHFIKLPD
jgi:hypothetical protein